VDILRDGSIDERWDIPVNAEDGRVEIAGHHIGIKLGTGMRFDMRSTQGFLRFGTLRQTITGMHDADPGKRDEAFTGEGLVLRLNFLDKRLDFSCA